MINRPNVVGSASNSRSLAQLYIEENTIIVHVYCSCYFSLFQQKRIIYIIYNTQKLHAPGNYHLFLLSLGLDSYYVL